MATKFRVSDHPKAQESDYGSDFTLEEESLVIQLLETIQDSTKGTAERLEAQANLKASVAADIFAYNPLNEPHRNDVSSAVVGVDDILDGQVKTPACHDGSWESVGARDQVAITSVPMDSIEYPDLSRRPPKQDSEPLPKNSKPETEKQNLTDDKRTPIERFRSFPKKPLTVTDISSGAWCELQYWYTLTQLPGGRKTRTAAMKGGTKVHQKLEDQVHTTVQVNISLKEEAFALRLWNLIQGLRTLRETGLTRELEVWGLIEGQVINGVIDELSYTSPNLGFEEELSTQQCSQNNALGFSKQQSSILDHFDSHRKRVYLTDVKTRGSTKLPSGAALRPSRVQLFLYHRLLGEMAAGRLDFPTIIARYGLQADVRFSDSFMAQIGSLHDEVFDEVEPGEDAATVAIEQTSSIHPNSSPCLGAEMSPPPDLIRYRSIQQIIPLVHSELRETFPQGSESLGDIVAVVYRHRDDGRIIGNHSFPTNSDALNDYLKLDLSWWLGKRNPDGVPIEEAYKCRICEFAENCEWRKKRNEEMVHKSRRRNNEG